MARIGLIQAVKSLNLDRKNRKQKQVYFRPKNQVVIMARLRLDFGRNKENVEIAHFDNRGPNNFASFGRKNQLTAL